MTKGRRLAAGPFSFTHSLTHPFTHYPFTHLLMYHQHPHLTIESIAHGGNAWGREPLAAVDAHVELVDAVGDREQCFPRVAAALHHLHGLPVGEVAHQLDALHADDVHLEPLE